MSNFNLRPIAPEIQDKLNEKSRLLRKEKPNAPNTPIGDSTELLNELYTRTTWAQMISLNVVAPTPPKSENTEEEPQVEWEKGQIAIIGSGGEVDSIAHTQPGANEPLMRSGFDETYAGTDDRTLFYKPPSGIRSINSSYAGNVKSLRKVRVEFTVFSLDDLERLSPHFFRVGSEVLVEFGWSTKNLNPTLGDKIIQTYKNLGLSGLQNDPEMYLLNKTNLAKEYENQVLSGEGDYDFAVGTISNFDYTLREDGGFNATVEISTTGVSIIDAALPKSTMGKPETLTIELPEEGKTVDVPAENFYDVIKNLPETLFYSLVGQQSTEDKPSYTMYDKEGDVAEWKEQNSGKLKLDHMIYPTVFEEYSENNVIQIFSAMDWKYSTGTYGFFKNNFKAANYQKFSSQVRGVATEVSEEGKVTREKSEETWWEKTKENLAPGSLMALMFSDNKTFLDYVDAEPQVWVRWGWFEDNILTRFTGYVGDTDSLTVYFHSVEPKLDETSRISDKGEFESSKFLMPDSLLTTDVTSVIIPDKIPGLRLCDPLEVTDVGNELRFNMFANLGRYIDSKINSGTTEEGNSESRIAKVEVEASANTDKESGYIRNLFFNAKALQGAFAGVSNLREGLDNIFKLMTDNFGNSNSFEVASDIFNPSRLGIIDKNLVQDPSIFNKQTRQSVNEEKGNLNKVYEFPAFEPGSMVKNQDLKVTIPNSMAVTALYGGNQPGNKISEYDPSRGGLEAQKLTKFLKLDGFENYQRIMNLNKKNQNVVPILEKSTAFGKYAGDGVNETEEIKFENTQNMFSDSFNKSLLNSSKYDSTTSPAATSIIPLPASSGSVYRLEVDLNTTDAAWAENKYNAITGRMKNLPVNFKNEMLYRINYDPMESVPNRFSLYNGLMDLSLTIDGTGGIFPGDAFITKYLPKGFQKQANGEYPVLYQAIEITQDLTPDTWSTTIKGMPRMNPKAFPKRKVLKPESQYPYTITPTLLPMTEGIHKYLNFFNMRADFVSAAYSHIAGINYNMDTGAGAVDTIFGELKNLMRFVDYSSVKGGNAVLADFSKVFEHFADPKNKMIIPAKKIWNPSKKEVEKFEFSNPMHILFYFQMQLMYVGNWMAGEGVQLNEQKDAKKFFYNRVVADTWFEDNRHEDLKRDGLTLRTTLPKIIKNNQSDYDTYNLYFSTDPAEILSVSSTWNWYNTMFGKKAEDGNGHKPPEGFTWIAWKSAVDDGQYAPWMYLLENELGLTKGKGLAGAKKQLGELEALVKEVKYVDPKYDAWFDSFMPYNVLTMWVMNSELLIKNPVD